jgi:tetratricopeptide (TPR) repeat protein
VSRTIEIARTLALRRSARAAAALLALAGLASGSLPLLDAPGYELGQAGALLAAIVAPFAGIAAWRLERERPAPSPAAAWGGATLLLSGLLAVLFGAAILRAALGPCSAITAAAGFLPLLAIPSAMVGAALAVAVAVLARGGAAAGGLYVLVAAASIAASLRAGYAGPAAFVFDPLFGAWPGPIYDEALVPDLRALLFRLAAAAEGVAVAAFAEASVRLGRSGRRAALAPALALVLAVAAVLGARGVLSALGLSGAREDVARTLGGRLEGERCTLIHPAEKPRRAVSALLSECEFHQADVARALAIVDPPHVTAWVYRSAEEKRRLVGASATEYAKPWLGEIHVVDAPLPHPILRHEIVHAVAARAATRPLGVPTRALVFVSAGLVEGLAVALETPRSRWTIHEWSRAARDVGLLPDVRTLVGPAGFWGEAPARAYTAAGSFLAFLLERHGPEKVREAYRTGDVAGAIGAPLDTLAAEWEAFLDGIEVPPGLAPAARARLSRPSLFARRCAREVASAQARAAAAARAGRTGEASALFLRARELSGSPRDRRAAADALARGDDLEAAEAAYREAEREAEDDPALRASIAAALGDLAWVRGDAAAAVEAWNATLATNPDRGDSRLLAAKIVAAETALDGARDYLLGRGEPALTLARVARADHPLAAYLVGRALATRGELAAALPDLVRAAAGPLPHVLAREARLLLGEARCGVGDVTAGESGLRALMDGASPADRARLDEALRRCAFLAAGGPPSGR